MKPNGLLSPKIFAIATLLMALMCGAFEAAQAQTYSKIGQVVTNFTLYARYQWTNQAGRVFAPGAALRLSDFAGSVVLFEFFDPT